jgi:hypothetical protein
MNLKKNTLPTKFKYYFSILLLIFQFSNITAQVVLTQSDVPKFGSSIVMSQIYDDTASLNNFRFSKSGINNTWDFTKLPKERYDTVNYVDPIDLNFNSFESATMAIIPFGKAGPSFYKIDNKGIYELGEVIIFNPFVGPFEGRTRPDRLLKLFPYKLGDSTYSQVSTFTPHYKGIYDGLDFDSVYHILNHTAYSKVIASGNIILPYGTFPAILERIDIVFRDSIFVKNGNSEWTSNNSPTGAPYIYYHWYIQGSLWHVARVVQLYADFNDYLEYAENAVLTSIAEKLQNENSLSIQINQELKMLKIESNINLIGSSYSIGNISGQSNLILGITNGDFIDISTLNPGIYYIRIKTKQNLEFIKKIILVW